MTTALPRHIAFIMDGNGRWARRRGMPRTLGHQRGATALRDIIKSGIALGIEVMTFYSFSTENWNRPEEEVNDIMGLLRRYLRSELAEFHAAGVRLVVVGDRSRLAPDIVELIGDAETMTAGNDKMTVCMAISYGSRQEILRAVQRLATKVEVGEIAAAEVDEEVFTSELYTAGLCDPDLLIRTSGEQRISNFLLWQLAYAELVFVDKFWPDFKQADLVDAIEEYQKRDRRFGAALGTA